MNRVRRAIYASFLIMSLPALRTAAAVKNPDTYTYLTISDADSLDPAWQWDVGSGLIILNVYEPLFMFDGSSTEKLVPILAEKVPSRANGLIGANGRNYTIPIRQDVKFQDGTPLTVEDVRYSILRFMLQDRVGGPSSLFLEPLLGYPSTRGPDGKILPHVWEDASKAVSVRGNSVVLRLPKPFAPLLSVFPTWMPIVSKAWAVKNGDWDGTEAAWIKYNNPQKSSSPFFERANGTGPFKLARWDRKTKEFILTRNENYWRSPAKLKTIVVKAVDEFSTRKLELEAGDADAIRADRLVFSQLENIPGVELIDDLPRIDMDPTVFFTYKINAAGNPFVGSGRLDGNGIPPDFFSDTDVRKGFAYAFDYKGFVADVERGKGVQATGPIPMTLPGHNPRGRQYHLDLEKAKEHFQKAWGGKTWERGFRFTMTYNTGNIPRQTICQILKRNIEGLNPRFHIDVRAIDWPSFLDASVASKLPIFIIGWEADFPDPHNFAFPLLDSKGHFPTMQKFGKPEFDHVIEQAVSELDPAKRRALYWKLQDMVFEEAPQLHIVDIVRYRAQRSWVKGWVYNPVFPDSPWGSYFYPLYKE